MRMKEGQMMRYCQLYTGQQMPVLGMGFYQVPVWRRLRLRAKPLRSAIDSLIQPITMEMNRESGKPSGNRDFRAKIFL